MESPSSTIDTALFVHWTRLDYMYEQSQEGKEAQSFSPTAYFVDVGQMSITKTFYIVLYKYNNNLLSVSYILYVYHTYGHAV